MVSMSPTRTTNKCQAFFDLYSAIVNKGRRLVRCQYFTQNPFCWNQAFSLTAYLSRPRLKDHQGGQCSILLGRVQASGSTGSSAYC
ncbi:hypothetical protein FOVSG1_005655 [Fusarium oxysporum f. sp. vasinfectum]